MSPELIRLLLDSLGQTLIMVAAAGAIGTALGLPLGVFLATSGRGDLFPTPLVNKVLGLSHRLKPVTPLALKPQLEAGQTVLP